MAFKDMLQAVRRERNLTQEGLAAKVYVTRQAVSRWENGETTPGIDMIKLLAVTLDVPVSRLLEMPERLCESCGMILSDPSQYGTEADGSATPHFCRWCYDRGAYTEPIDMETMIEDCAPRMVEHGGFTLDEAVSLMGAVLPNLRRWKAEGETAE